MEGVVNEPHGDVAGLDAGLGLEPLAEHDLVVGME
jgi:hypothetical protein